MNRRLSLTRQNSPPLFAQAEGAAYTSDDGNAEDIKTLGRAIARNRGDSEGGENAYRPADLPDRTALCRVWEVCGIRVIGVEVAERSVDAFKRYGRNQELKISAPDKTPPTTEKSQQNRSLPRLPVRTPEQIEAVHVMFRAKIAERNKAKPQPDE